MQLALENVFFRCGEFFIENLSISISSGFTVITGRSGSGKTTLLSLLSGLEKPDKGSLILDGIVQHSFISRCGVIFQHPERQLFAETVFKDVSFALCRKGHDKSTIEDKTEQVLLKLGVSREKWYQSPFSLSGGERRKVAIAGVLVSEPDILLLDEPSVGLDLDSFNCLVSILREYRTTGKIAVAVTHDESLFPLSDHAVVMDGGHITKHGSPVDTLETETSRLSERLGLGRTHDLAQLAYAMKRRMEGKR